jgi:CheY-like chemotaxis protein/anti-anti-sigma regulatory factor
MTAGTVLLVDDEPIICGELAVYLSRHHYQVHAAADGRSALELLAEHEVDVIITDYRMPGMDGIELMRVARRLKPNLPVILVSGQADIQTAVRALKEDAADFLQKPFDLQALLRAIQTAMEARQAARLESSVQQMGVLTVTQGGAGGHGLTTLHILRPLDESSRAKLLQAFTRLIDSGQLQPRVLISLKSVRYINNVGLNLLVELANTLRARNYLWSLTELNEPVTSYLKRLGYFEYFPITLHPGEAAEKLTGRTPASTR